MKSPHCYCSSLANGKCDFCTGLRTWQPQGIAKNPHAVALGSIKSERKAKAARENGRNSPNTGKRGKGKKNSQ